MLLFRLAPEGFFVAGETREETRVLLSDPYATPFSEWQLGRSADLAEAAVLPPVTPGKIVGVGRNFRAHAEELGHETPAEPLLFLKAPSSVVGPRAGIVLPPESRRVDYEGEIALVVRETLRRATRDEARRALLGVTCACDVTARDLQRQDATFARSKSFDTFCPLGPAICVDPELESLLVLTRLNGEERQRGRASEMIFDVLELLVYISAMMTLEPGDVVLSGTPSGVGALRDGDRVEVEIPGLGVLDNPVEGWRRR